MLLYRCDNCGEEEVPGVGYGGETILPKGWSRLSDVYRHKDYCTSCTDYLMEDN